MSAKKNSDKEQKQFTLTSEEQNFLLKIARETLESYVKTKRIPEFNIPYENLKAKAGAFVTLTENHSLRGCIGYIAPIKPLYQAVIENAVNSSSKDYRFSPVVPAELKEIHIEITVLSPPAPVKSYKDIVIGKHGIILKKGYNQSVFLPQVATEQGWDIETTLKHLSLKAGLSADEWREGTDFEVFTGIILKEGEKK